MDRLRDLGVNLLGARNRAIGELVLECPPSLVAEALGYSTKVAFHHADKAAEPWAATPAVHQVAMIDPGLTGISLPRVAIPRYGGPPAPPLLVDLPPDLASGLCQPGGGSFCPFVANCGLRRPSNRGFRYGMG